MIIGPAHIVTGGAEPRVIEDGGVRIAGAHIAQVGPIGAIAAAARDETVWPAAGRLLLPGIVDAHAHLARHLARGLDEEIPWERYDRALAPEDVRWAALAALIEALRHGITTVCDLHRSGSFLDFSLSEVADAARRLGVRVATAYAADETDAPADRRAAMEESIGLASELRRARQGRIQALLGMRARTPALLPELIEASRGAPAPIPIHVEIQSSPCSFSGAWRQAETAPASLWAHVERAGSSLWSRLDGVEALGVASPGAPLSIEPAAAWGSDAGPHAPPPFDSPTSRDREQAPRRHYERVFVTGARWAERVFGEGLGVLEPGAPADLVLVDYHPATELDLRTFAAHLAVCVGRAPVSGVMVAGEIVLDHGKIVTLDEQEVSARARECARRVWRRIES